MKPGELAIGEACCSGGKPGCELPIPKDSQDAVGAPGCGRGDLQSQTAMRRYVGGDQRVTWDDVAD
jgi:hypothetical protein